LATSIKFFAISRSPLWLIPISPTIKIVISSSL
jgi:hypothetical protein